MLSVYVGENIYRHRGSMEHTFMVVERQFLYYQNYLHTRAGAVVRSSVLFVCIHSDRSCRFLDFDRWLWLYVSSMVHAVHIFFCSHTIELWMISESWIQPKNRNIERLQINYGQFYSWSMLSDHLTVVRTSLTLDFIFFFFFISQLKFSKNIFRFICSIIGVDEAHINTMYKRWWWMAS